MVDVVARVDDAAIIIVEVLAVLLAIVLSAASFRGFRGPAGGASIAIVLLLLLFDDARIVVVHRKEAGQLPFEVGDGLLQRVRVLRLLLLHRHRKLSPIRLRWRVDIEQLGSTLITHTSDAVVVNTDVDIDVGIVGGIVIVIVIVIQRGR